ncbi:hypothetical protein [Clostridium sp. LP20]|uniref:hypothetical protein n=1 Tax=Clostridium sp. LP20 TaxID=3418665 RepID=UPI003EE7BCDA
MISEICGKISRTGSNLDDRREDKLTGDVFGTLRYISFNKVMKELLLECNVPEDIRSINMDYWAECVEFWPYDEEGELDCIIYLPEITIGIEVKYLSGISSDDGKCNTQDSNHQLARESRILGRISRRNGTKAMLIFIAQELAAKQIYIDTMNRNIIDKNVKLSYLSWQTMMNKINDIKESKALSQYEKVILLDILNLLKRKGFCRFKDFVIHKEVDENLYFKFNSKIGNFNFKVDNLRIDDKVYYKFENRELIMNFDNSNLVVEGGKYYEFK